MKAKTFALFVMTLSACSQPELPYEQTFKNAMIRHNKVEPLVESIVIEKTYDSALLYRYWNDQLKIQKNQLKDNAYSDLFKAKQSYNESVRLHGKRIAKTVYLDDVERHQRQYDKIQQGVYEFEHLKIYEERTQLPSRFEQLTVKYRLAEGSPLLVGRYRTDIFKGDTSFYELKPGQTLKDYINGK